MAEVGRDLWRSSGLVPLLRQGHAQQVVQDPVQEAFEDHQGGRLHILPLTLSPAPVVGSSAS